MESDGNQSQDCYTIGFEYFNDESEDKKIDYLEVEVRGNLGAVEIVDHQGCRSARIDKSLSSIILLPSREFVGRNDRHYMLAKLRFKAAGRYRFSPKLRVVHRKEAILAGMRTVEIKQQQLKILSQAKPWQSLFFKDLQNYLGKNSPAFREADFFRRGGPMWVDFEQEYVAERTEANKIIERFMFPASPVAQIIVGGPASGKSSVARTVGYRLQNEKAWVVFVLEDASLIGSKVSVETILHDIRKLVASNESPSFLLIEDVHRNPRDCSLILEGTHNLIQNSTNRPIFRLLLTSRPTYEEHFTRDESARSCLNDPAYCERTDIDDEESSKRIVWSLIDLYTKKVNRGTQEATEEERTAFYQECGEGNLWVLKYFLRSWAPGQAIKKDKVLREVLDDLIDINKKYGSSFCAKVIITIATFYQYEIPVEEFFITNTLNLENSIVQQMSRGGDIVRTMEEIKDPNGNLSTVPLLRLHHPALAELYIETSHSNYRALDLRERPDHQTTMKQIQAYIRAQPMNSFETIEGLPPETLGELLGEKEERSTLIALLNKERDVERIGWLLHKIDYVGEPVSQFLGEPIDKLIVESLDIVALRTKLDLEPNLEAIGVCLWCIGSASMPVLGELLSRLDRGKLRCKFEAEKQIWKIGIFVHDLASAHVPFAENQIKSLGTSRLVSKLDAEQDLFEVGAFLWTLRRASADDAARLADALNFVGLKSKLDIEHDLSTISECLWYIREVNVSLFGRLVEALDVSLLIEKLDQERDLSETGFCLGIIAEGNDSIAERILNNLDSVKLRNKLDEEANIMRITLFLSSILGF